MAFIPNTNYKSPFGSFSPKNKLTYFSKINKITNPPKSEPKKQRRLVIIQTQRFNF